MGMNIFRMAGDMSHLFSIIVLLLRLRVAKNAQGISVKTQELYLAVFLSRYLDLFTSWFGLYNMVMKIVYICSTAAIVYTIRYKEPIKTTYDKSQDSFLHWQFAAAPSAVLALIVHLIGSGIKGFNVLELLWTFSIILESIAILPQLVVLQRYGEVENLTGNYVFFLGAYRALYILNWVYRSQVEPHYRHHWLTYICGIIQTILYADFFYYYIKSKRKGGKFSLPTTK
ncbi:ER lumen protein retaining receptor [Nitzschia inconspicua]|uniref:ER lumen protein retaining receptor n=1 Tax=Nitzschia inconspicua TaxID=303405 RepID=A0A9K3L8C1_9STRA|nr:ER lumen protein retaining receptor [Nitzschia inconspicua]